MKQLLTFIRKEFYHVLRDRRVLLMLFGLPIVQVILFGFALSNEIKNTGIAVFDQDKSVISSALISKIDANKYFDIDRNLTNPNQFQEAFKDGKVKIVLVIPSDFSENLSLQKKANLQMIIDGTDINLGNQISNYLQNIILDFIKIKQKTQSKLTT